MKNYYSDFPSRKVRNKATGEMAEFSIKLTPREALISAHAYLTLKDSDYRNHEAKYGALVEDKDKTLVLGEWEAQKVKEVETPQLLQLTTA